MPSHSARNLLYLLNVLYGGHATIRLVLLAFLLALMVAAVQILHQFRDVQQVYLHYHYELVNQWKLASSAALMPSLLVYNTALCCWARKRHVVGYCLGTVITILCLTVAVLLATRSHDGEELDPNQLLLLLATGFLLYFLSDTLAPLLFNFAWSFFNSHLTVEQAAAMYGIFVGAAQAAAWIVQGWLWSENSWFLSDHAPQYWPALIASTALGTATATLGLYAYVRFSDSPIVSPVVQLLDCKNSETPSTALSQSTANGSNRAAGYCCGKGSLCAALADPYTWGIFLLEILYAMEFALLDYAFTFMVKADVVNTFPCPEQDTTSCKDMAKEYLVQFITKIGNATNQGALLLTLLGTSFILRHLGISRSLTILPWLGLVAVGLLYVLDVSLDLHIVVGILILVKVFGYAVFIPSREILYMTTNAVVRYHLRPWFTMVLVRWSKAAVLSVVTETTEGTTPVAWTDPNTTWSPTSLVQLVALGTSFGLVSVSMWMSRLFTRRLRHRVRLVVAQQQEGHVEDEGMSLIVVSNNNDDNTDRPGEVT